MQADWHIMFLYPGNASQSNDQMTDG